MGKCYKCGKRGLFLKVNAFGYCIDCAKAMRELEAANRITKAQMERKPTAYKTTAPAFASDTVGINLTVAGVTFKTGRKSRQTILREIYFQDPPFEKKPKITLEKYKFEDEDAVGVYANGIQVGNIARKDLPWVFKYWDRNLVVKSFKVYGGYEKNWGMAIELEADSVNKRPTP